MTPETNDFIESARALLGARAGELMYPCIQDLIHNGLVLDRFPTGKATPSRQDVTHYLGAWLRHAGLSELESRGWLIHYCVAILSRLSRRSPAAIRHSTKSCLSFIYKSQVPFSCGCEDNSFKARCSTQCPAYGTMRAQLESNKGRPAFKPVLPPQPMILHVPLKAAHKEQFKAGLTLARQELAQGKKLKRILELLHQRDYKTRTGRKWTYGVLRNELLKCDAPSENPAPPGEIKSMAPPEGG